jgi:hypothetical protein
MTPSGKIVRRILKEFLIQKTKIKIPIRRWQIKMTYVLIKKFSKINFMSLSQKKKPVIDKNYTKQVLQVQRLY